MRAPSSLERRAAAVTAKRVRPPGSAGHRRQPRHRPSSAAARPPPVGTHHQPLRFSQGLATSLPLASKMPAGDLFRRRLPNASYLCHHPCASFPPCCFRFAPRPSPRAPTPRACFFAPTAPARSGGSASEAPAPSIFACSLSPEPDSRNCRPVEPVGSGGEVRLAKPTGAARSSNSRTADKPGLRWKPRESSSLTMQPLNDTQLEELMDTLESDRVERKDAWQEAA